jgi:DNA-binding Lrp family transcriptional regulator
MLKESDLKIFAALRADSRQTLSNISKKTEIPVSTVYDRIRLHENGVIKKHTSILDFPKIGYNIRLNVMLSPKDRNKFLDFIGSNQFVNSAYKIDGNFDFMIDCIFKYMNQMHSFMEELEKIGLEKKQTYYVIEELLRENFLPSINGGN